MSGEVLLAVDFALPGVRLGRWSVSLVGVRLRVAAWALFLDAAALPLRGKSLRDWKLRGLRPRTITGPE